MQFYKRNSTSVHAYKRRIFKKFFALIKIFRMGNETVNNFMSVKFCKKTQKYDAECTFTSEKFYLLKTLSCINEELLSQSFLP